MHDKAVLFNCTLDDQQRAIGYECILAGMANRHHAITELAESGASEQTIIAIAGHVSRKMLERYSHIRMDAKRAALEAITGRKPEDCGAVYGAVGDSIPVYTDFSLMDAIDGGAKKLEVATVPE